MEILFDALFLRTWWTYQPIPPALLADAYHWFNLAEGLAWLAFAGLVAARYLKHRRSPLELAYAAAFLTFGLSDFREAWSLQSWLIWTKLVNLILLLRLRSIVLQRYYPQCRLY